MNNKWDPYVLVRGTETETLFKNHFSGIGKKCLFLMGKGFDIRMNIAITELISHCPNIDLDCWLIEFDEGTNSHSHFYKQYVDQNVLELIALLNGKNLVKKQISLIGETGKNKKRVGDRNAASIVTDFSEISAYSDIIIDISALPRGIYFSLIGKVLALIDSQISETPINLLVSVAENAAIDTRIKEYGADDDLGYLHGFGGGIELSSEIEKPVIWFPILGEGKKEHFSKALDYIMSQARPYEICPILPFPTKNPRRVDSLIIEFHSILFDRLGLEAKNIMYVPEQNPFEAYIRLNNAIKNYNHSLLPLNGCKAIISSFSSKLLSIGALLSGHELRDDIGVGILNVDPEGYKIDSLDEIKNLKADTELFLSWLTGDPYKQNAQ